VRYTAPTLFRSPVVDRMPRARMRADGHGASLTTGREAAKSEAAKLFSLSDFHRRRLLLEERL
jgi:hypothetical protein